MWRRLSSWAFTAYFAVLACGPVVLHLAVSHDHCHCLSVATSDVPGDLCDCPAHEHNGPSEPSSSVTNDARCLLCDYCRQSFAPGEVPTGPDLDFEVEFANDSDPSHIGSQLIVDFWSRGPPHESLI